MEPKNKNFSIEEVEQWLRASRFYQLFTYGFWAIVSTGLRRNTNCEPPAARHLTADWDLDRSDLKVPPD